MLSNVAIDNYYIIFALDTTAPGFILLFTDNPNYEVCCYSTC
jgi:hypothetical protein